MGKITYKSGKKHPKDKIFFINNYPITFEEWAKLGIAFYMNEDNIYNKPWQKGGEMVREFINDAFDNTAITKEMKVKYKLK